VLLADEHGLMSEGSHENSEREDDSDVVGRSDEGEQAASLATELQPEVTHMDTAIPRPSGIEATRQGKAIHPATAVLILAGYDICLSILLPRVFSRLADSRPLS
jgi:DNA-binding NarL/FixJ family response regulator